MKKQVSSTGSGFYRKRKDLGLCVYCEDPPTVGATCLNCWFKITAVNHLGSRKLGPAIKEIWEKQKGLCIYTRVPLIPGPRSEAGGNASLDHLLPLDRGGTHDLSNLQWTTEIVNRMKTNMTEPEFFEMCETILFMRSEKIRQNHSLTTLHIKCT